MKNNKRKIFWWFALIAGLLILNFIASKLHARYDLTEEKRYSLTPGSRELLRKVEAPLAIDVFLKGDFPTEFRKLSNTTREFLSVLRDANPLMVRYRFVDPHEDAGYGKTWSDSLRGMGIEPINLSVQVKAGEESKNIFPYALVHYKEGMELVNLFQSSKRSITVSELNNAEALMEYQFAKAIDNLVNPELPIVAYATGHGEPVDARAYDIEQTIGSNYKMFLFNLKTQPTIPDTIRTLVIVKPTETFSDEEKLKLDQYVIRGGKLLFFLDNLNAEQDSLSFKSKLIAYERDLNLQDLLFNYGARINPDLIMDLQCNFMPFAVGGSPDKPQYEFLPWNYYPLFESKNNHSINRNLGLVAGRFVNSIDTVDLPGIKKTWLLQTSNNSRTISTPALISPDENRNTPEDALFKQKGIPAAVLLEGQFNSLFRARLSRSQTDSLAQYGGFREKSEEDGKMIIVADGDIVLNDVSTREGFLPMGVNLYTVGSQYEYQFANRDFLLNCLEYLTSKTTIIQARNKEIVLRRLDISKVESEKTMWQFINIALPVILIVIIGLIYQQLRRRKFAARS